MLKPTFTGRAAAIEAVIRRYCAGCNSANAATMEACFMLDAVHYFPDGSPFGAFRGASVIAQGWIDCVHRFGSSWTIDDLIIDAASDRAALEWTHNQPKLGRYVRGAEWYLFAPDLRIAEIRAYSACPAACGRSHELAEYPYVARSYWCR